MRIAAITVALALAAPALAGPRDMTCGELEEFMRAPETMPASEAWLVLSSVQHGMARAVEMMHPEAKAGFRSVFDRWRHECLRRPDLRADDVLLSFVE